MIAPADKIAVNVIVPAHNAGRVLADQLNALSQQIGAPPFDVTVVTNRCTDDTRTVALGMTVAGLSVRVVDAPMRSSAGYARNVGAANTNADYILFCDADDVVGSNWVAEMYKRCALDGFDVVGGRLHVDTGPLAPWLADLARPHWDGDCSLIHNGHRYAITASMGCRRDVFEVLGGFDESLPDGAGAEDTDFGIRCSLEGFTFGEAPDAFVQYRLPSTLCRLVARTYRYSYNGEALAVTYGPHRTLTMRSLVTLPTKMAIHALVVERRLDPRVVGFRLVNGFAATLGRWRYQRQFKKAAVTTRLQLVSSKHDH
jgi:glycosyltransferase involved in cell wall biosynthesis